MDRTFNYHQNPDGTSGYYQDATDHKSFPSQNSWYPGQPTSVELYGATDNISGYQYCPESVQTPYVWQSVSEQHLNLGTSSTPLPTESALGHNAMELVRWEDMDKPSQDRLLNWYSLKGIEKGDKQDLELRTALKEALKQGQQHLMLRDQNVHVRYCGESMKRGEVCKAVLVLPKERRNLTAETLQCRRCLHRKSMTKTRLREAQRNANAGERS